MLANENWPRPALLALRTAGVDVQSIAAIMPSASDLQVLGHASTEGRWVMTFERDYGELVFMRAVPPPPAILPLRQGAFTPLWPAQVVLDLLARAGWVHGNMALVSGRVIRRRALPPA